MSIELDLKRFVTTIEKQLGKTVSRTEMKKIGQYTQALIVARTRAGYGVETSTKGISRRFKLPPFSASYIDYRIRNNRKLSRFASLTKPNNTFSGNMLNDFKVTSVSDKSFVIGFRSKESQKKAEYLAEMGRNFVGLTKKDFDLMVDFYVKNILNRIIKD